MRRFNYTIANNELISPTVTLLTLKPVAKQDRMRFAAGQYVSLGFERGGRPTPVRSFSIVSSPGEPMLQVAMRVRGDFTAAAGELRPGDTVSVLGPFGEFVFNGSARRLVLVAGGIGVTPFISMIRYAAATKWPGEIVLLYGSQSQADLPFAAELDEWARRGRLRLTYAISDGERNKVEAGRNMVAGRISKQLLAPEIQASTRYYVCGPAGFMAAIQRQLQDLDVPNRRIMSEAFGQSKGDGHGMQLAVYGLTAAMIVGGTGYFALKHLAESGGLNSTPVPTAAAGSPAMVNSSAAATPAATPYQTPRSSVS